MVRGIMDILAAKTIQFPRRSFKSGKINEIEDSQALCENEKNDIIFTVGKRLRQEAMFFHSRKSLNLRFVRWRTKYQIERVTEIVWLKRQIKNPFKINKGIYFERK